MKAVFVREASLLRDSHVEDVSIETPWQLMPATIEALRLLATDDTLVLLYAPEAERTDRHEADPAIPEILHQLARQIEAGGARVDGLLAARREALADEPDGSPYPGMVWTAAIRFSLQPEQCYLLGDGLDDVRTAGAAGVRPVVILGGRSIDEVFGRADVERDFPMAPDLITAVHYIQVEEDTARQLGHARGEALPVPSDLLAPERLRQLATLSILSPQARSLADVTGRARVQRSDIVRWLFFLSFGALGLSLGIAYLLTHLYRSQPFPEFVYYLTLQFIPRVLRGALFILVGLGIITVAIRSIRGSAAVREWLNSARRSVR